MSSDREGRRGDERMCGKRDGEMDDGWKEVMLDVNVEKMFLFFLNRKIL